MSSGPNQRLIQIAIYSATLQREDQLKPLLVQPPEVIRHDAAVADAERAEQDERGLEDEVHVQLHFQDKLCRTHTRVTSRNRLVEKFS